MRADHRAAIGIVICIAIVAAILSYSHALAVVRPAHTTGRLAYLVPLLPDGLILLSSVALYEAASAGAASPVWAKVGLVVGCAVTLAMNVAAGWRYGWGSRLIDALAPVVLLLALEILAGILRRGRDTSAHICQERPALSLDDAIRAARPHMSLRELEAAFGVSKTAVARMVKVNGTP